MNVFKVTVEKDVDDTLNIFIIEYEVMSDTDSYKHACKPIAEYIIGNKVITKVSDFSINHSVFLESKYINSEEVFEKHYGLNDKLFSFSFFVRELDYINIQMHIENSFLQISKDYLKLKNKFKAYNSIFENI